MTMTEGSGEDDVFDGVFDREAASEPAPEPTQTEGSAPVRDEKGRFAPKAQAEEEPAAPEPEPQAPAEPTPAPQDTNASRHVPLSELMAERKKRQEFEQRLMEAEARAKAFEAVSQRQPQFQQAPQFQQQQPEPPPDFYTDPEAALAARIQPMQQQFINAMLHQSEIMARDKYGDKVVDAALQAANAAGDQAKAQFLQTAHPWGEMVKWHKRQQTLSIVGDDPEAYRAKLETELREKIMAELKAPKPAPKFPGSLAQATATGEQGAVLTEEAAMGSIFASGRDRRRG